MVYLNGGPSHIDLYDLKPDAPVEYRGEFKPIKTNVPGFDICELMPLQAKIADKLAIIRNMKFQQQGHTPPELFTGFLHGNRPSIGSVVSKLRADAGIRTGLPPYVYLGDANHVGQPGFLGKAHEAYIPGSKAANLGLARDMTLDRLDDRRALLAFLRRAAARPRRRPRQHGRHGCLHGAGAGDGLDQQGPRRLRHQQGAGERCARSTASASSSCKRGGWSRRACRW